MYTKFKAFIVTRLYRSGTWAITLEAPLAGNRHCIEFEDWASASASASGILKRG